MQTQTPQPAVDETFDAFMTSGQLAQTLGISDRWVRKLAEQNGFGRKFGHTWLFTRDECTHLIEQRKKLSGWRKRS